MNYELAKELQKAGWPGSDKWQFIPDGQHHYFVNPTLSEIIEACGEMLVFLVREDDGTWTACQKDTQGVPGKGPTPEEAVTRLWLALNRKP